MSLGVMNVLPCHDERSGWPEPTRPTRPWGAGSGAQEAGCRAVAYSRRLATLAGNLPSIATALQFHPVWKPRTLFWIQEVNRGKELNGEQVPWDTLPPDGQMAMRTGLWVDRAPMPSQNTATGGVSTAGGPSGEAWSLPVEQAERQSPRSSQEVPQAWDWSLMLKAKQMCPQGQPKATRNLASTHHHCGPLLTPQSYPTIPPRLIQPLACPMHRVSWVD